MEYGLLTDAKATLEAGGAQDAGQVKLAAMLLKPDALGTDVLKLAAMGWWSHRVPDLLDMAATGCFSKPRL